MTARASTETEAANLALDNAGQPPIADLTSDKSLRARVCRRHFGSVRDTLLREKWWSFAKGWDTPAAYAGESSGPLKRRYVMPADCLRVRYIDGVDDEAWDLENAEVVMSGVTVKQTVLVTNVSAPVVAFTRRIEEVRLWDPVFLSGFAEELASKAAKKLGRSVSFARDMHQQSLATIESASAIDSKEQSRQAITRDTSWILARRGIRSPRA